MRRLFAAMTILSAALASLTVGAATAGVAGAQGGQTGVFVPLTPARALDTRLLGAKAAANAPTNANLTAVGVPPTRPPSP